MQLLLLYFLALALAAVSSALASQDTANASSLAASSASSAPLEAGVDGHCPLDSYHSCRLWGHPEACCGPGTDCAYNEHEQISCCPRDTFCKLPVGQGSSVFIQISMAPHQAWGGCGHSMGFWVAVVAVAYEASKW